MQGAHACNLFRHKSRHADLEPTLQAGQVVLLQCCFQAVASVVWECQRCMMHKWRCCHFCIAVLCPQQEPPFKAVLFNKCVECLHIMESVSCSSPMHAHMCLAMHTHTCLAMHTHMCLAMYTNKACSGSLPATSRLWMELGHLQTVWPDCGMLTVYQKKIHEHSEQRHVHKAVTCFTMYTGCL